MAEPEGMCRVWPKHRGSKAGQGQECSWEGSSGSSERRLSGGGTRLEGGGCSRFGG